MVASIVPLTFDITLLPPAEAAVAAKALPAATASKPHRYKFTASSPLAPPWQSGAVNPFTQPSQPSSFMFNPPPVPSDRTLNWNWFRAFNVETLPTKGESWLYMNGARGQMRAALTHFLQNCQRNHFRTEHQAAYLSLRIERQQDTFNTPNPHHDGDDGKYWDRKPGDPEIFKLGTVLLGPGTLFYDTDDRGAHWALTEGRKQKVAQGATRQQIREWLDEGFKPVEKRSVKPGEIAKWVVGNDCQGTIHSEPNMSDMPTRRIFVSLVPGTADQIRELAKRWGGAYELPAQELRFN